MMTTKTMRNPPGLDQTNVFNAGILPADPPRPVIGIENVPNRNYALSSTRDSEY
jgi:hypothetical protein